MSKTIVCIFANSSSVTVVATRWKRSGLYLMKMMAVEMTSVNVSGRSLYSHIRQSIDFTDVLNSSCIPSHQCQLSLGMQPKKQLTQYVLIGSNSQLWLPFHTLIRDCLPWVCLHAHHDDAYFIHSFSSVWPCVWELNVMLEYKCRTEFWFLSLDR